MEGREMDGWTDNALGPTCGIFCGFGACLGQWDGQQRGTGELAHGSLQGSGRTVQGVGPS